MSIASAKHMNAVASAGCVICSRFGRTGSPAEIHHIGEGSGERSDFAVAGLCYEHHRGTAGIHGLGTKAFLRLYKLPTEYHLLIWANEDIAKKR